MDVNDKEKSAPGRSWDGHAPIPIHNAMCNRYVHVKDQDTSVTLAPVTMGDVLMAELLKICSQKRDLSNAIPHRAAGTMLLK